MESGLNTFKTCYCDFINQLVLYDDQNNTIKTYVDKIDSSDNLISDILNDMINEIRIKRAKKPPPIVAD